MIATRRREYMQMGENGLRLLKEFEGLRLEAYRCPAGVLTIGYGHTKGVYEDMTINQDEADSLLREDLDIFEDAVADLVNVPLNQNQFDALVSFTYNLGQGALRKSTLLRILNEGDYEGAAEQLLRWNKAGGVVLKGLVRRREAERKLFLLED